MGKTIDKILLSVLSSVFTFILIYTFTDSVIIALTISILLIAVFYLFTKSIKTKTPKNRLSKRDFIRYILLNGNRTLKTIVECAIQPPISKLDADDNTILIEDNHKYLVYYAYKFGAISEEDVAKCYRIAKSFGADTIYALTNHSERKALAVAEYIPQKFTIVGATTLYKFLKKTDLIPKKEELLKRKTKITNIVRIVLNGSNVKYYLVAGASSIFISAFTPYRTYYMLFAFLNLILAALSIAFREKNAGECDIFKR